MGGFPTNLRLEAVKISFYVMGSWTGLIILISLEQIVFMGILT
jgi:hypothetical protein